MQSNNYNFLFAELSKNLQIFIQEVQKKKLSLMATDKWTVKEVLCHIVFWHENYAANYKALAENKVPPLLDGPGYKLNPEGVASLKKYSVIELIKKLNKAQNTLHFAIVEKKVPKMTYKQDGHIYKTENFLKMIARHVVTHTKQVKRAKQN